MSIVTVVMSLAVPVNDGVRSFEGEGGRFSVTVGEAVSTVNVTGVDVLVSPSPPSSVCSATAVYVPSGSGEVTLRLHASAKGGKPVVSVCSGVPWVLVPG